MFFVLFYCWIECSVVICKRIQTEHTGRKHMKTEPHSVAGKKSDLKMMKWEGGGERGKIKLRNFRLENECMLYSRWKCSKFSKHSSSRRFFPLINYYMTRFWLGYAFWNHFSFFSSFTCAISVVTCNRTKKKSYYFFPGICLTRFTEVDTKSVVQFVSFSIQLKSYSLWA